MIKSFLVVFGLCACLHAQPVLRISKVAAAQGEGAEQLVCTHVNANGDKRDEAFWVEKAAIITEADVKEALEGFGESRSIMVQLTEQGGVKMGEATGKLDLGVDRLAIIIDGKVVSAPVVQAKLGRHFVISGLESYDDKQFGELMKRLNTKPAAEP